MIRFDRDLKDVTRENVRGGSGRALVRDCLDPGDMAGIDTVSRVTLEAGASIGEHLHEGTEELYYVLEGRGTGFLDGDAFDVGPGDAWLCNAGHTHGLVNRGGSELAFLAVLSKK